MIKKLLYTSFLLNYFCLEPTFAQSIDYFEYEKLFEEPVTMSATGKPQRVSDSPINMDIITAKDISKSAAHDIPGILKNLVGIDVMQWSVLASDVNIRGYDQPYSSRLLVLVNGRQVYLDHFGVTSWSLIPVELSEILQIEVVRGPNTALFGFNAVSGVINIITYNPIYYSVNSLTTRIGTPNYKEVSLTSSAKEENLGVRISASEIKSNNFKAQNSLLFDEYSYQVLPLKRSGSINVGYNINDNTVFNLEATTSEVRQNEFIPTWRLANSHYMAGSIKTDLNIDSDDFGILTASVYHNLLNFDMKSPTFYDQPKLINQVTVVKIQDLFKIDYNNTFRISGEWRRNEMNSTPFYGGDVRYDIYSGSIMLDHNFLKNLTFTNAIRFDYMKLSRTGEFIDQLPGTTPTFNNLDYDKSIKEPSYNSGLVYKPTKFDTIRLSTARGIQIPSLVDYGFYDVIVGPYGSAIFMSGNPGLKPTVVNNYEINYDRKLISIDSVVKTSLYHQNTKDLTTVPSTDPSTVINEYSYLNFSALFLNIGNSSATGFEIDFQRKLKNLNYGINYSYEIINDNLSLRQPQYGVNFHDTTPRHKINVKIGYEDGPIEYNIYGHYISTTDMLRLVEPNYEYVKIPNYISVDFITAYNFNEDFSLSLEGKNINKFHMKQTSGIYVEPQILLSMTVKW